MNSDEIRNTNYEVTAYLREIAAQLADLNVNIKLMLPTGVELSQQATELYEAEDEILKEQNRQFQELVDSPTSEPDKYIRCSECAKKVDIPSLAKAEGRKTIICDSCIPF